MEAIISSQENQHLAIDCILEYSQLQLHFYIFTM